MIPFSANSRRIGAHSINQWLVTLVTCTLVVLQTGCQRGLRQTGPYQSPQSASRNPLRAQELTSRAAAILEENPERAKQLLQEALTADIFYGPAHNNLGVVLLAEGLLYEAAQEFEWANKLMPGQPDPRVNLALTLERAGQVDEAVESYRAALEMNPGQLDALKGIVRLQVRHNLPDEWTTERLRTLALRAKEADWKDWALVQLAKRQGAAAAHQE